MVGKLTGLSGIWEDMVGRFGVVEVMAMLYLDLFQIDSIARNKRNPNAEEASRIKEVCILHGIHGRLYTNLGWKDHRGIMVYSCPEGWKVFMLEKGFGSCDWIGGPHLLQPADAKTIAAAKLKGWPW